MINKKSQIFFMEEIAMVKKLTVFGRYFVSFSRSSVDKFNSGL